MAKLKAKSDDRIIHRGRWISIYIHPVSHAGGAPRYYVKSPAEFCLGVIELESTTGRYVFSAFEGVVWSAQALAEIGSFLFDLDRMRD